MSIPHPRPQRRTAPRSGFTLIEMLVVISIIGILAGLLMPAIVGALDQAKMTQCGNNQRQIMLCMQLYKNQSDGEAAFRQTDTSGAYASSPLTTPDAAAGRATSLGSLELMAFVVGGIGSKVFTCPSVKNGKLSNPGSANNGDLSAWGGTSKWAAEDKEKMGFAYDWAAPSGSEPTRVVLADRGRDGSIAHKNKIMAVYADNHIAPIILTKGATASGNGITENFAGGVTTGAFHNPDSSEPGKAPDNIYDNDNDGGVSYQSGKGSATRAWVQ